MGYHSEGKKATGVGHCDICWMRIFRDEPQVIIDGKLLCEDCVEELDE
ncbi:hypothetical protein [Bacillus sp. NPDC077027]